MMNISNLASGFSGISITHNFKILNQKNFNSKLNIHT